MVSNLAVFRLATYLATFQKIGRFFPNHLVTLVATLSPFLTHAPGKYARVLAPVNNF
jgi:hypothetical protein